ncbi:hypothetical protein [Leptospira interrogans]|nr:hypothetical protein [Leptospira interrogans]EMO01988.1 hypothetical protein LEP1GSC112_0079 [Leptospira interrogans serovar Pomona str. UT364]
MKEQILNEILEERKNKIKNGESKVLPMTEHEYSNLPELDGP